jgi:hypothetical protein
MVDRRRRGRADNPAAELSPSKASAPNNAALERGAHESSRVQGTATGVAMELFARGYSTVVVGRSYVISVRDSANRRII